MVHLIQLVTSLGNAGAVANARKACEQRRIEERRIEDLEARLGPARSPSAA